MLKRARSLLRCLLLLCTIHATTPVRAGDRQAPTTVEIAVVYNSMRDDAGFNWLVTEGIRSFEMQKHVKVHILSQPRGEGFAVDELETALTAAIADGVNSILILGTDYYDVIDQLSRRHPQLRFVVIDGSDVAPGNTQTVQFRAHEAAYLAGIVAARTSKTGVIGFVGGADSPIIRAFGCAYAQGARATRHDLRVHGRMIGRGLIAYSDPAGGRRMAQALLQERADVIFAAAGGSGLGVLGEVAKAGAFGIGVDANQNGLYRGRILTSVLKRMDVSVYTSLLALHSGQWQRGLQSVGLSESAVGLAMDEHNRHLLDERTRADLEAAEFAIRSGEFEVIDAQLDGSRCDQLIEYPQVREDEQQ